MKASLPSPQEAVWRTLLSIGDVSAIQSVLAQGLDVGVLGEHGHTPLMLAAQYADSPDIVRLLLASGADADARDRNGRTAVMHAIDTGASPEVVAALGEAGTRSAATTGVNDPTADDAVVPAPLAAPVKPPTVGEKSMRMVADAIVRELRAGVPSWVRPWSASPEAGLPFNVVSRKPYSSLNALWLWSAARERGYTRHAWLTPRQAEKSGGTVRTGEKPTLAFSYFGAYTKKRVPSKADGAGAGNDGKGGTDDAATAKTVLIRTQLPAMKAFLLYNVAQVDGLPKRLRDAATTKAAQDVGCGLAKQLLDGLGADVRHGGDRAFFHPSDDFIQLPLLEHFQTPQAYLSTSLHEHVHWTGHTSRLKRVFGKKFGDERYAFEELLTELATAFLCARFRVDGRFDQSVAYINTWIKRLSDDPRYLFQVILEAEHAVDFMKAKCPSAFD